MINELNQFMSGQTPATCNESWDGDDADLYDGAPAAIQDVARRLQEEKVLTLAEIIDECLKMAESSNLAN